MRVCIDIQSAITQRAGVGRYTKLLVQNLGRNIKRDSVDLAYFDFKRRAIPFTSDKTPLKAVHYCPGRIAQYMWKTINWPPYNVFFGNYDLYHFPNFIIPPLKSGKTVVTIHDMSFLRYPSFAEEENLHYLADRINDTVSRADAIITDSEFSANEIHTLLDVDKAKIHPIHLGIDDGFCAPDADVIASTLYKLDVDKPYILAVGTIEPRKNIPFLIEVFERLHDFKGNLVIAGMPGWKYEPILDRIRKSSCASRIKYVKYVRDDMLPALYAGARLYVTTSVYEGFGFPPLEAMACGTPVMSSSGGSLGEVLGSDAVVISEFDANLWAGRMNQLLMDKEMLKSLSERGLKKAASFTWAQTAKKTWEVYRKCAECPA